MESVIVGGGVGDEVGVPVDEFGLTLTPLTPRFPRPRKMLCPCKKDEADWAEASEWSVRMRMGDLGEKDRMETELNESLKRLLKKLDGEGVSAGVEVGVAEEVEAGEPQKVGVPEAEVRCAVGVPPEPLQKVELPLTQWLPQQRKMWCPCKKDEGDWAEASAWSVRMGMGDLGEKDRMETELNESLKRLLKKLDGEGVPVGVEVGVPQAEVPCAVVGPEPVHNVELPLTPKSPLPRKMLSLLKEDKALAEASAWSVRMRMGDSGEKDRMETELSESLKRLLKKIDGEAGGVPVGVEVGVPQAEVPCEVGVPENRVPDDFSSALLNEFSLNYWNITRPFDIDTSSSPLLQSNVGVPEAEDVSADLGVVQMTSEEPCAVSAPDDDEPLHDYSDIPSISTLAFNEFTLNYWNIQRPFFLDP